MVRSVRMGQVMTAVNVNVTTMCKTTVVTVKKHTTVIVRMVDPGVTLMTVSSVGTPRLARLGHHISGPVKPADSGGRVRTELYLV